MGILSAVERVFHRGHPLECVCADCKAARAAIETGAAFVQGASAANRPPPPVSWRREVVPGEVTGEVVDVEPDDGGRSCKNVPTGSSASANASGGAVRPRGGGR